MYLFLSILEITACHHCVVERPNLDLEGGVSDLSLRMWHLGQDLSVECAWPLDQGSRTQEGPEVGLGVQWNWDWVVQTEAWSARSLMAGAGNRGGGADGTGSFLWCRSLLGLPAVRSDALAWLTSWMECSNDPAPHLEERGESRTSSLMWELTSVSLSAEVLCLLALYGVLWTYRGFRLQGGQWFSIPMWKTMNVRVCWDPRGSMGPLTILELDTGGPERGANLFSLTNWVRGGQSRSPGSCVSGSLCVPTATSNVLWEYLHLTRALVWWALNLSSCSVPCFFLWGGVACTCLICLTLHYVFLMMYG